MPLLLRAYARLLLFDFHVATGGFPRLYRSVAATPVASCSTPKVSVEEVCSAVDIASIWYWKRVLCLQRSAVLTIMLRELGIAAELVIGVQQVPFKAHAWTEVDGHAVNDKAYMAEIYAAIDRIGAPADVLS